MKASRIGILCGALILLGFAQVSHADTFDFSFTGPENGSGTLTATYDGGDQYTVTGLSGNIDSVPIFYIAPETFNVGNDNNVFRSGPAVDGDGLGFGALIFGEDIYYSSGTYYLESCLFGVICGDPEALSSFTLTQATAPEPSMLSLLGIGFVSLMGLYVVRRRFSGALNAA